MAYTDAMSSYELLAPYYDEFFPQSSCATSFLLSLAAQAPGKSRDGDAGPLAVDFGCATGSQVLDLAANGWRAVGWEPCAAMLEIARRKARERRLDASFEPFVMQDATTRLEPRSVDLALCLGNTLPHLGGEDELARFIADLSAVLAPGGAVALQLLNYERVLRILASGEYRFPTLRARDASLERSYALASDGGLEFRVVIDSSGGRFSETNRLSPFTRDAVASRLASSGFERIASRSGWDRESFDQAEDDYLIVVARREGTRRV